MAKDFLTISVNIRDIDIFNDYLNIMKDLIDDTRIDSTIREEYRDKILQLTESDKEYDRREFNG